MKYWLLVALCLFITLLYTNEPVLIPYLLPTLVIITVAWHFRNTQYENALLALQESEEKFRDLFENAPLPYQSLDKTGRLLHINQAWLNLIQPPNENLIGRFFHEFVNQDSKAVLDNMLIDIEKQLIGSLILKLECTDKTRLILIKWQVVKNIKKQFQYIHCILIDITEHYEAEQSSKESQATLAAVYDDLVQFTYIAAHHLQEPSRRIVTFAQRLRTQLAEQIQLDQEINTTLTFIEQSATRQKLLVRDIQLYLAAIKPIGRIEKHSLCAVLIKVIKHHATLIKETNAKIEYNDLPTVHFDLPRLYDIFKILIDNSLRYRHPERIPHIKINAETKSGRVYISVTDNGMGIPEDYRERVFLVFERLGTDKSNDSTGIGLSIVRRIIISSHGQVKIQETPNGGTTVLFDLPE